jgi:hypothetical protein
MRKHSKRGKKTKAKVIAKTKNKSSTDVQVPLNTAGVVSGSDEKLNADKGGTSTNMAEDGMEGEVKGAFTEDADECKWLCYSCDSCSVTIQLPDISPANFNFRTATVNDVTIEAKSFVKNLIKQLTTFSLQHVEVSEGKFLSISFCFYPYLSLLSLRSYHAVYCGNVCESCWVESDKQVNGKKGSILRQKCSWW